MDPFWIQVECQPRPSRLRRPHTVGGIISVRGICSEATCRDLAGRDPSYSGTLKRLHPR